MRRLLNEWLVILSVFALAVWLSCLFVHLSTFKGLNLMPLYGDILRERTSFNQKCLKSFLRSVKLFTVKLPTKRVVCSVSITIEGLIQMECNKRCLYYEVYLSKMIRNRHDPNIRANKNDWSNWKLRGYSCLERSMF